MSNERTSDSDSTPALARAREGLRSSMTALTFFVLWLLISVAGPLTHGETLGSLQTGLSLLIAYGFFTAATYLGLSWRVWTILRASRGALRRWLPTLILLGIGGGVGIGLLSSRLPVAVCFGTGIAFAVVVATDAALQLVCRNRLLARLQAARDSAKSLATGPLNPEPIAGKLSSRPPKP